MFKSITNSCRVTDVQNGMVMIGHAASFEELNNGSGNGEVVGVGVRSKLHSVWAIWPTFEAITWVQVPALIVVIEGDAAARYPYECELAGAKIILDHALCSGLVAASKSREGAGVHKYILAEYTSLINIHKCLAGYLGYACPQGALKNKENRYGPSAQYRIDRD